MAIDLIDKDMVKENDNDDIYVPEDIEPLTEKDLSLIKEMLVDTFTVITEERPIINSERSKKDSDASKKAYSLITIDEPSVPFLPTIIYKGGKFIEGVNIVSRPGDNKHDGGIECICSLEDAGNMYVDCMKAIEPHIQYLKDMIDSSKDGIIRTPVAGVAKEMNMTNTNIDIIRWGLKYSLFQEGIVVDFGVRGKEQLLIMRKKNDSDVLPSSLLFHAINKNVGVPKIEKVSIKEIYTDKERVLQELGLPRNMVMANKFLNMIESFNRDGVICRYCMVDKRKAMRIDYPVLIVYDKNGKTKDTCKCILQNSDVFFIESVPDLMDTYRPVLGDYKRIYVNPKPKYQRIMLIEIVSKSDMIKGGAIKEKWNARLKDFLLKMHEKKLEADRKAEVDKILNEEYDSIWRMTKEKSDQEIKERQKNIEDAIDKEKAEREDVEILEIAIVDAEKKIVSESMTTTEVGQFMQIVENAKHIMVDAKYIMEDVKRIMEDAKYIIDGAKHMVEDAKRVMEDAKQQSKQKSVDILAKEIKLSRKQRRKLIKRQ